MNLIKRLYYRWKYRGSHWNCATKLPSPAIKLVIIDDKGNYRHGKRPSHVPHLDPKMERDLGYRDELGNPVIAKRWQYA